MSNATFIAVCREGKYYIVSRESMDSVARAVVAADCCSANMQLPKDSADVFVDEVDGLSSLS